MPRHFKILLCLLLIGTVASSVFLVFSQSDTGTKTLRVGHAVDLNHATHKALVHFKQQVEEISDGAVNIKIYASGQLGTERDMIELLQVGSLAMTKVSAGPLESFVPEMQIFSLPYVFDNAEHFWRVLESELGEELLLSPLAVDLRGLAFFDGGSRSFYTCPKAVNTPDDLSGMKIRVMKSQSAVELMGELGASATPISFGELYTALQQGVVDGAENSPITYYKARHYEICQNFTLDEHNSIPGVVMFSNKIWQKLNEQERSWLKTAMKKTVSFQRELWNAETEIALEELRKAGVNIIYPDKAPFQEKVKDYKAGFKGTQMGDIIERIEAQR